MGSIWVYVVHLAHLVHAKVVHLVHVVHVVPLVHVHLLVVAGLPVHLLLLAKTPHVLCVVWAVEVSSVEKGRVGLGIRAGIRLGVGIPLPVAVASVVITSPVRAGVTTEAPVAIVRRASSPVVAVPVGGIGFGLGFRLSVGNSHESENYEKLHDSGFNKKLHPH